MALVLASRLALAPTATPAPPAGHAPAPTEAPAPTATRFEWIAPASCPDAAVVRAAIEHYTGRTLDDTAALLRAAHAEVEEESSGEFGLRLQLEVGSGAPVLRLLHDRSCEVLAETAALMIAVTIDPTAITRAAPLRDTAPTPKPEPPKPAPAPTPAPKPAPATSTTPSGPGPRRCDAGRSQLTARARAVAPDWRPCVALDAHVGAQLGVLPKIIGPGIAIAIGLTWPRLRVELGASHWFRRPARIAEDPPRGGDLQLTAGSLGACARLGRRAIEVPLCAGAELGALGGRGVGVEVPRTEQLLWLAGWAGPRLLWVVHPRLSVQAAADLVVPLARYRFEVAGLGVVHRVTPVAGRLRLGLGVRI